MPLRRSETWFQKDESIAKLAERITEELMQNSDGQKATRLQLRGANEEDFGGWSRDSVYKAILATLGGRTMTMNPDALKAAGDRLLELACEIENCAEGAHAGINSPIAAVRGIADGLHYLAALPKGDEG